MKTQLLYLDAHDDSASTLEKLRWVQADHVVLVWPSHGRILHRRIDLVLLQREATRRAARLGVLSHDPDVRLISRDLGLPVFDDLAAVSRQAWPAAPAPVDTPRPPRPLPARPDRAGAAAGPASAVARRTASMLFVIAALLALSIAVGPAAVIELTPLEKDELLSLPVVFGESPRSETDSITLPTRSLEVQVEAHTQSPTLGTVQVPVAAATGLATFTNRGQDEVSLPEGTGLRTLGTGAQRFETTELALIPAGIGSEVTVPIRAIVGGPAGNVAAGAIGAIEGPLGLSLTVTNGDRLSGGRSESRRGVSAADVQLARAALERQLLQSANAALQELLNEDEALVPQSIRLTDVLQREFSPDPGDASEIIQGTMVARVSAEVYDVASLQSEAAAALARGLGGERELVPGSLRVDLAAERAAHQARVGARSRASVDFGSLSALVAGRSQAEAADLLAAALDLAAPPRFRLWPEWWPRLPLLPLRVQPVWVEPTE